ncbi:MAG TPA: hypothetical protein VFZ53_13375 [Polyangiaceae bacterium]
MAPASTREVGLRFGIALGLGVAGCQNEGPTFSNDVAPILKENCVACHRSGGIAPFALTDYDSAKRHARSIADATETRTMPPMPVNNDGSCNTYANARWLTVEEIETLEAWADDGAPKGDGSGSIEPPPAATLDDPDIVLELSDDYLPNDALADDYRCFVLPAPVAERAFMTRYELVPGDPRVVHHAILFQPNTPEAAGEARALDDAEAGDGYTCFGGPGVAAAPVALWAPGAGVVEMPAGTGVALEANRDVVLQIHYNLEHGAHTDRTRLELSTVASGVVPGTFSPVLDGNMMLPPGREYVETTASTDFVPSVSLVVHGAMPHMHTLGRTLRVDAEASGETRCLVDVDRWDFHWQNAWWYEKPVSLDDLSSLSIRCGYDTRTRSEVTTWGEGTADEMCISYFYVTPPDRPDFSCTNAQNPLFGSCVDAFFEDCYAPDVTGACTAEDGVLGWADGSRFVSAGTNPGFYGPNEDAPCIAFGVESDGAIALEKGGERVTYSFTADGAAFTCPDGSTFEASTFHVNEFGLCQGIACPLADG